MIITADYKLKLIAAALVWSCWLGTTVGQINNDSVAIQQLISEGFALQKSNLDSALIVSDKAIALSKKKQNINCLANSLKLKATTLYFQGEHEKAIALYLDALNQFDKIHDSIGIAEIYNELGTLWKKQGDLQKAESFFDDALQIFIRLKSLSGQANTLNNIGLVLEREGKYEEALIQYSRSLAIHSEANNKVAMGYCLANLGGVYTQLKRYKEAENALLQSLALRLELNEFQNTAICYTNLGEFYGAQNNFKSAIPYYLKSLEMAKKIGFIDLIQYDYESLSHAYAMINDFKQAYVYHTQYSTYKDSIFDENKNKQLAELQTKYDSEKKEQENLLLSKDNQLKGVSLRKAQLQNYALITILFLMLAVIYLIYTRIRFKQQKVLSDTLLKQEQLRLRSVILTQEQERKRISQDLHDGLGQMLSAVKLNLAAIENIKTADDANEELEKAIELIDESCAEIRNISHNMMPAVLIKSGLIAALNELAKRVSTAAGIKVFVDYDEAIGRFESDYEINIFRVLQELLNNIIKHAQANEVHIHLNKEALHLNIMVEDNGKKFDTKLIEISKGNGWYNINSRLNLLNAKLEIESNSDSGTVVFIDVPVVQSVNKKES